MSRFSIAQPPNQNHSTWACVDRTSGAVKRAFTPDQVCIFEFADATHAVVGSLGDPATWKCYR